MHSENQPSASTRRTPWNKGKLIGAKPPLRPNQVWSILTRLLIERWSRDLALFNLAIDSKLRGCDVVALRVEDFAPSGYALCGPCSCCSVTPRLKARSGIWASKLTMRCRSRSKLRSEIPGQSGHALPNPLRPSRAMCGRLRVGKSKRHVARSLVGATMCSAC